MIKTGVYLFHANTVVSTNIYSTGSTNTSFKWMRRP